MPLVQVMQEKEAQVGSPAPSLWWQPLPLSPGELADLYVLVFQFPAKTK